MSNLLLFWFKSYIYIVWFPEVTPQGLPESTLKVSSVHPKGFLSPPWTKSTLS